jgi:hypothetical protein
MENDGFMIHGHRNKKVAVTVPSRGSIPGTAQQKN